MRLHVLGLPHVQASEAYLRDAFGMKIVKFCRMMVKEGHEVTLYASEDNETPATLVTCITKKQQAKLGFNGPEDYLKNDFDASKPLWQIFHQHAIYEMKKLIKKGDIICTFSGRCDAIVAEAFPEAYFVETGIGYSGVYANFRVYESYAWMHTVIGSQAGDASKADGRFYDTVIPNYYDPEEFPESKPKDYFLFVGRLINRKGLKIIEEIAKRLPNEKFIIAGAGGRQEGTNIIGQDVTIQGKNIEYVGMLNVEQRAKLMSEAKALICPTLYIGPFEGVSVEANLCGTPVITTNFGSFTENNIDNLTGFRCNTIKQFVNACKKVHVLNRKKIREYAQSRFTMDVIGPMYTKYFEQLKGLENGGFYE